MAAHIYPVDYYTTVDDWSGLLWILARAGCRDVNLVAFNAFPVGATGQLVITRQPGLARDFARHEG
jgi:hypothetical protein